MRRRKVWQRFAGGCRVKHIGVEVGAVGPHDRAEFRVDAHAHEVVPLLQRRKDAGELDDLRNVYHAFDAIFESQAQARALKRLNLNDIF